jgi:hypothetical protein
MQEKRKLFPSKVIVLEEYADEGTTGAIDKTGSGAIGRYPFKVAMHWVI